MTIQRVTDEAAIRRRIDELVNEVRAMNLAGVMAMYAPDVVSFDIGPLLWYMGAETKRKHWVDAFATYQPPLEYEVRNLTITVGDDVAFGHSLNTPRTTPFDYCQPTHSLE